MFKIYIFTSFAPWARFNSSMGPLKRLHGAVETRPWGEACKDIYFKHSIRRM